MAFYGFNGDADNCYWTLYTSSYNYDSALIPIQDSFQGYSFPSQSELNYTFSEPRAYDLFEFDYQNFPNYYGNTKFLQYEPPVSDRGCYIPSQTIFRISYSVSEFNEPEFEEYDPTPYGGGYDPAVTYGKPLLPSDLTCYPRSLPKSDSVALENFSYNSVPSPYGKEDHPVQKKPQIGSKPVDTKSDKEAPVEGKPGGADVIESADDDTVASSDDDCNQNGLGNGLRGDYGFKFDRIPYGSGLESLDLCESIFGHWPCLDKIEQQKKEREKWLEVYDRDRRIDPWETAADYIFGNPAAYDCENYHQPWH